MEWIVGLLVVLVFLGVFAACGHLAWIVVARVFGFRVRTERITRPTIPLGTPKATDDLSLTAATVGRLLQAGLIDAASCARVMTAIRAARGGPSVAQPPPLPATVGREEADIGPPIRVATEVGVPQPAPRAAPVVERDPEVQPVPAAPAVHSAPVVRAPRRPLADILTAFIEEKNIRWGELLGGLLIVGCSTALVISFWAQISGRPFFRFAVLASVTASLFGLGLYTEHRWRLPTTSRGVLLIATLLVPLNFLAFAALTRGGVGVDLIPIAAGVSSLVVFALLVHAAARVLSPAWPVLLTTGVCGLAATSMLLSFGGPVAAQGRLYLLVSLVAGIYLGVSTPVLLRARRWRTIRPRAGEALLLLVGTLTFAAATALGLLVRTAADSGWALRRTSIFFPVLAMPALLVGLLLWRRSVKNIAWPRITGAVITFASVAFIGSGLACGWPDPASLIPLLLCTGLLLALAGLALDLPIAHYLGGPCLVLAWIFAFHVWRGDLHWFSNAGALRDALLSPANGWGMLPLAAAFAGLAELLQSRTLTRHAGQYAVLALAVFAAGASAVSLGGLGAPAAAHGAVWIYLVSAIGMGLLACRWESAVAGSFGWLTLALFFVQVFLTQGRSRDPWTLGLLAGASVAVTLRLLATRSKRLGDVTRGLASPTVPFVCAASAAALVLLLWNVSLQMTGVLAVALLWAGVLWFVLALIDEVAWLSTAGQLALACSVIAAVMWSASGRDWFATSPLGLADPMLIDRAGVSLGLLCLGWMLLRRLNPTSGLGRLTSAPVSLDGLLPPLLLAVLLATTGTAAADGVARELARYAGPISQTDLALAHAAGPWALLFQLTVLACVLARWKRLLPWQRVLFLVLSLWAVCPLLAARMILSGESATTLRWSCAAFGVVALILIDCRSILPRKRGTAPGSRDAVDALDAFGQDTTPLVLAVSLLPVVLLTLYCLECVLVGDKFGLPPASSLYTRIGTPASYAIPLALLAIAVAAHAASKRSAGYAWGGALLGHLAVTVAFLFKNAEAHHGIDGVAWLHVCQLNAAAAGVFSLIWLGVLWFSRSGDEAPALPGQLRAEIGTGIVLSALLLLPAEIALFVNPVSSVWLAGTSAGTLPAWLAILTPLVAAFFAERRRVQFNLSLLCGMLVGLAGVAACVATRITDDGWTGFHAMLGGYVAATGAMLGAGVWMGRRRIGVESAVVTADPVETGAAAIPAIAGAEAPSAGILSYLRRSKRRPGDAVAGTWDVQETATRWIVFTGMFSVLLCLRAMLDDPMRPWWSAGGLVMLSLTVGSLACWRGREGILFPAGILLNLAATLWLLSNPLHLPSNSGPDLVAVNIIVLACCGLIGWVLQTQVFREGIQRSRISYTSFAALGSLLLCTLLAVAGAAYDLADFSPRAAAIYAWPALAWTTAIMAVSVALKTGRPATRVAMWVGLLPWCWAWLPPGSAAPLDRVVVVLAISLPCAIAVHLFATRTRRVGGNETSPLQKALHSLVVASVLAMLLVLIGEAESRFGLGRVAMRPVSSAVVTLLLAMTCGMSLVAAVRGKLGAPLSDDVRRGGVYVAEVCVALLLLHLRCTMPWLFGGRLQAYWPLVVMGLAFAGVGVGEMLRRRGVHVLSDPLHRTGIFLPLLPVIGFWMSHTKTDYSELLFLVGGFYLLVAILRRSVAVGLVSALAANAGLWFLLGRTSAWGIAEHPQLWLIPPALCVLIAAQFEHERLSTEQLRGIRYACLSVIYLSSTADIFLIGVSRAPWLPLVLMALSVFGVFCGLILRIRPFLFLGSGFLGLAILTMISYAARSLQWTWIWYVAGIALGISIIALFAVFEKKRPEMLALIEGLKRWE